MGSMIPNGSRLLVDTVATAIITQAPGILTNDKRLKVITQEGLSIWLFNTLA